MDTEIWVVGVGSGTGMESDRGRLSNWSNKYPNKEITNIICGHGFTVFIDEMNNRYFVTECSIYGEAGAGYNYEPRTLMVSRKLHFSDNIK